MRRKTSPHPLVSGSRQRSLRPAATTSLLPSAASIAIALAALGCSTPTLEIIAADPATTKTATAPLPASSPAPSATTYLEPDPHDIDGDIAVVSPAPVTSTKKPTTKPHP